MDIIKAGYSYRVYRFGKICICSLAFVLNQVTANTEYYIGDLPDGFHSLINVSTYIDSNTGILFCLQIEPRKEQKIKIKSISSNAPEGTQIHTQIIYIGI